MGGFSHDCCARDKGPIHLMTVPSILDVRIEFHNRDVVAHAADTRAICSCDCCPPRCPLLSFLLSSPLTLPKDDSVVPTTTSRTEDDQPRNRHTSDLFHLPLLSILDLILLDTPSHDYPVRCARHCTVTRPRPRADHPIVGSSRQCNNDSRHCWTVELGFYDVSSSYNGVGPASPFVHLSTHEPMLLFVHRTNGALYRESLLPSTSGAGRTFGSSTPGI